MQGIVIYICVFGSSSACQEFSCILYNPQVHYHVHLDYTDIYIHIIHQSVSRVSK